MQAPPSRRLAAHGQARTRGQVGPTTRENLQGLLATHRVDLVAVGRAFIANPDLAQSLRLGAPLDPAEKSSFYGCTHVCYIDHPALDDFSA